MRPAEARDRAEGAVATARRRSPLLDHLMAALGHYARVNGNGQAGAITYYGFLSVFPILALAFFFVGLLARVYKNAEDDLVSAVEKWLPGMIGSGPGQVEFSTFTENAGRAGLLGFVVLVYAGLRWLSSVRTALNVVFDLPQAERPNYLVGKLRDLVALGVIGVGLLLSMAISAAMAGASTPGTDGWGPLQLLLWVVGHLIAVITTTLLFLGLFRLLALAKVPHRPLIEGAALAAVGFELLKSLAYYVIPHIRAEPAFKVFGVALVLLIWINYFARIMLLGAAWAQTSRRPARTDPEGVA